VLRAVFKGGDKSKKQVEKAGTRSLVILAITSDCVETNYLGPALRTSSLGNVNCVKFFLKRAARSLACRS
jgi:hypothetical protein